MDIIFPHNFPLLCPYFIKLFTQAIHETAYGVAEKRDNVSAGFACEVELTIILCPRLIVMIA